MISPRWVPILNGEDEMRLAARDALFDIAHALPSPSSQTTDATLGNGDGGFAIFHAYMARSGLVAADHAERHNDLMLAHVQSAVDKLPPIVDRLSLFSGVMGVAWAVNHLQTLGVLQDGDELCDAVDEVVLDGLNRHAGSMLCELVAGLSGIGVYGLARCHRPAGQKIVGLVLRALDESTVLHEGLRTWFHAPEKQSPSVRDTDPEGSFNLGLAHGVPGALAFLARSAAHHEPGARELLPEATAWLLRQQRRYRNGSRFAYTFVSDPAHEADGARLSWCYGDLGVSAALLLLARHAQRADWESAALELARGAAQRRGEEDCGVVDAGLCHGAFGNAHIFGRLHAATRDPSLRDAALHWIREGLGMRRKGAGLAGFCAWRPLMPGEPERDLWQPSAAVIDGICGIGLALLGLIAPVEPAWDEIFMVNIPVRGI
jgi:lantibiotic biosynthesis protein